MDVEAYIARWTGQDGGAERANYATFLIELCDVIGVPRPDPASAVTEKNDYVFERFVKRADGTNGRIDLYKRDCFVLEAKQSRQAARTLTGEANDKYLPGPSQQLGLGFGDDAAPRGRRGAKRGWDVLMINARGQAEDYARHLPQDHGWPPFVIVCDVGHSLELFADFRRMGKYEQFPDRQSFRIYLSDLRDAAVRERLRAIWTDPYALDPSKRAAKTTREIAKRLAEVTKALEAKEANPEDVAHFLMRCIFTMFAEDWKLLPQDSFTTLLERSVDDPSNFPRRLKKLWELMDTGGWSDAIDVQIRHFNGGLFRETTVFELGRGEIGELLAAAKADWREVEPAIFGTLLEQALDPKERKKLGAHYTPRAYVERLVTATIIDPLREDWALVLHTADRLRTEDPDSAVAEVQTFHDKLCNTRVLDPACGTGNFLYVSLELMKRLEGEVLEALADLGGQEALTGLEGHTVDPHQFLGLELNPRAAAIAELVLWIGYLQQHFRMNGAAPGDPILRAFKNINFGKPGGYDAVLTWDGYPLPKVVTGKETHPNARRPEWPEAEFIVGNPPFIGKGKDMRDALGDAYVEALWACNPSINDSADYVMYWWDNAAALMTKKRSKLRRFGLVSTNSITQEFSRRTIKKWIEASRSISILLAIPDHPWVKGAKEAAAVRIAMTVVGVGDVFGLLRVAVAESHSDADQPIISFTDYTGHINSDLTVNTDVTTCLPLRSNRFICTTGVIFLGDGFLLTGKEAAVLKSSEAGSDSSVIRPYLSGRDQNQITRGLHIIDLDGYDSDRVRQCFPAIYQRLLGLVKPLREKNRELYRRENWWLFARPNTDLRAALEGLPRYLATTLTSKHRFFQFVDGSTIPDQTLVCVGHSDAAILALLSSSLHVKWSLRSGGWLGVGNDSRYLKGRCFDPFPFPPEPLKADLRAAGEELDAFRRARQAEHPRLTLTQMYNVREALRAGRTLTPDEERIKDEGLILILNELHDRIDRLTFEAYGWPQDLTDEQILEKLVALNKERAAEERRGVVRWVRPDYQKARAGVVELKAETAEMDLGAVAAKATKPMFPPGAIDQGAAVTAALLAAPGAVDAMAIALTFKQGRKVEGKVTAILQAMARTGAASSRDGGKTFQARRAA